MIRKRPTSRLFPAARSALLWRGFWLLMLLAHAKAVAAAWAAFSPTDLAGMDLVRPIGLTLASVFFVLKLFDVSWLRFRTDRRALAALGLIVALLHLQTVGLAAGGHIVPQVLATASAVLFLEPVQRRWDHAFDRMSVLLHAGSAGRSRSRPLCLLGSLTDLFERTPQWRLIHTSTPPRAPPA